jgi:DNA-binding CsgD family transcriptional regulator
VSELIPEILDATRLIVDLQQVSDIAQGLSSELTPEAIAQKVTDSLVEKFGCAFSRIWLVETDQSLLRLVASSGLYTSTNGSFARVPMGAFKVGKIAKNRIAFLSNNLPEEEWVKDREWAIANQLRGFAGYPLSVGDRVIGVLATFSYHPLTSEFLEVLRFLCILVTVALDASLNRKPVLPSTCPTLSEQLAQLLPSLTLVGTEQSLMPSLHCIFLRTAEVLGQMDCNYCRLTYDSDSVALTAILTSAHLPVAPLSDRLESGLGQVRAAAVCLGGSLQTQLNQNHPTIQILLTLPYSHSPMGASLYIACQRSLLQNAFSQLAQTAGLVVTRTWDEQSPILTDDATQIVPGQKIIWVDPARQPLPKGINARIDLSIEAAQLRQAVEAVMRGEVWGIDNTPKLSERELATLKLLSEGLRDRDIAQKLMISESTVKFHINNVMSKLKAKTRYQALYLAVVKGWVG